MEKVPNCSIRDLLRFPFHTGRSKMKVKRFRKLFCGRNRKQQRPGKGVQPGDRRVAFKGLRRAKTRLGSRLASDSSTEPSEHSSSRVMQAYRSQRDRGQVESSRLFRSASSSFPSSLSSDLLLPPPSNTNTSALLSQRWELTDIS